MLGQPWLGTTTTAQRRARTIKVTICHKGKTISVNKHALKAHLNHGDYKGKCKPDKKDKEHKDKGNHKKHY